MSTILFVSACFFLTSDKTLSAAALSSRSCKGKKSNRMHGLSPPDQNEKVLSNKHSFLVTAPQQVSQPADLLGEKNP